MQQQSNGQNKFLIDADIGDDDVTLPNLPAVNVPIVETQKEETTISAPVATETVQEDTSGGGFFSRMKVGLTKTRKNLADGMVNILIGGKEIDDELLEEVEEQLLVADIGVDATKTIIANLTERTARGDLIYSHSLYKALQEELVALLAPRVKPLHIDPNKSPFVILVVGVNGVGKTTTIGKLGKLWRDDHLTIALIGVVAEIVLVIILSSEEAFFRAHFGHHRLSPDFFIFQLANERVGRFFLCRRMIENHGTILGADIVSLPIERARIVNHKEYFEQIPIADLNWVECDAHHFGVSAMALANRSIHGIVGLPTTVTRDDRINAIHLFKYSLQAPEAAATQRCRLSNVFRHDNSPNETNYTD